MCSHGVKDSRTVAPMAPTAPGGQGRFAASSTVNTGDLENTAP
jgi:hypothetical protein